MFVQLMRVRNVIFWSHLVVGCFVGLAIAYMAITGSMLAFRPQIIAFSERNFRSTKPADTTAPLSVDALLKLHPEWSQVSGITLHRDSRSPVELQFGRERMVLADRYTGAVYMDGESRTRQFFAFFERAHRFLALDRINRKLGETLTACFALLFLALQFSGVYLWLPQEWKRRMLLPRVTVRRRLTGRAWHWSLHHTAAFWGLLPMLLLAGTGVAMGFDWADALLFKLTGSPMERGHGPRERRPEGRQPVTEGLPLQTLFDHVVTNVPKWQTVNVQLPGEGQTIRFNADTGNGARPDLRSQLTLDRSTGKVVRWQTVAQESQGQQLHDWMHWIHTGESNGIIGQCVTEFAAICALLLVWSGLSLAWPRLRGMIKDRSANQPTGDLRALSKATKN